MLDKIRKSVYNQKHIKHMEMVGNKFEERFSLHRMCFLINIMLFEEVEANA